MRNRLPVFQRTESGEKGRTAKVRLYLLETGWVKVARALLHREDGFPLLPSAAVWLAREGDTVWIPVVAYLIVHDDDLVMVDTGLHEMCRTDPVGNIGHIMASIIRGFRVPPGTDSKSQIGRLGYAVEQVKYVIISHLHTDHASALEYFSLATILLGRGEWEAAQGLLRFQGGYNRRQFAFPYDFREVPQDPIAPVPPFDRGYDLFNDGTVVIVPTPGHTIGHQSIVVRLPSQMVLLAGDAVLTERSYRELSLPGFLPYKGRLRASLEAIRVFSELHPESLVIPGHDPEKWPALKKAPDHYE
ncbi:MAG: N-acyl homoserine lactonase family protein [Candidatus Rokubacteria bacterium]|nr:N-acyl homoserine lactonase family protein [Candidatus Rokubacteria bacterium]